MDASPLNKLPAELRNNIYELALHNPGGIDIDVMFANKIITAQASQQLLALTETCKQIRQESLPLFYATNTFSFATSDLDIATNPLRVGHCFASVKKWFHGLGEQKAVVNEVEVYLGGWYPYADNSYNHEFVKMIMDYQGIFASHSVKLTIRIMPFCNEKWDFLNVKIPMHDLDEARRSVAGLACGASAEQREPCCGHVMNRLSKVIDGLERTTADN